jgi:hypothetical protein
MDNMENNEIASNGAGRKILKDRRTVRRYGFACANCRKRKARCDGVMPTCDRCLANKEQCHFDKYFVPFHDHAKDIY